LVPELGIAILTQNPQQASPEKFVSAGDGWQ